jgi:flagellar motor component MotA
MYSKILTFLFYVFVNTTVIMGILLTDWWTCILFTAVQLIVVGGGLPASALTSFKL